MLFKRERRGRICDAFSVKNSACFINHCIIILFCCMSHVKHKSRKRLMNWSNIPLNCNVSHKSINVNAEYLRILTDNGHLISNPNTSGSNCELQVHHHTSKYWQNLGAKCFFKSEFQCWEKWSISLCWKHLHTAASGRGITHFSQSECDSKRLNELWLLW